MSYPEDTVKDEAKQVAEEHGGYWGEHPDFPLVDWLDATNTNATRQGYWEWVVSERTIRAQESGT